MLSPRWRKIRADLNRNRTRTILVVLSIVVGIFAVGSIAGTGAILDRESKALWEGVNPSSATVISTPFDEALIEEVEALPEVATVQVRRSFDARVEVAPGEFKDIQVFAVPDYQAMQLNLITDDVTGDLLANPADGTIWVERSAVDLLNTEVGGELTLETPGGEAVAFPVEGLAYDVSQPSASVLDVGYGYVSMDTMATLTEQPGYNILQFTVAENADDTDYITQVGNTVRDLIETQGGIVFNVQVPTPGEPPGYIFILALILVLGVIGSLTFLLSGFLIVNIISALLAQQTRQIGIMKAIGAKSSQVVRMYLGMALIFGVIALLIGVPLAYVGSQGLAGFIATLNNYKIDNFGLPWWVFALQIVIGLVVPVLSALVPVFSGTRVSIREALDSRGIDSKNNTIFDLMIARLYGLPRPVLLSFRNTFRQKGRLALTLITLTLAGAIFATVFTVRNSLFATLDDALGYDNYDVAVDLSSAYSAEELREVAQNVDGVTNVEAWTGAVGRYVSPEGAESDDINLRGLPPTSETILPIIQAGRWLEAGDTNAIVLNGNVVDAAPQVGVGDEITLIVRGEETTWEVVGIAQAVFSFENDAWTPYATLSETIGESGLARTLRVTTEDNSEAFQNDAVAALTADLAGNDFLVDGTTTTAALRTSFDLRFNTLVGSLLALAALLAVVGGLGIAGTTSINVLERMREIGVMRSVGAADYQVLGIFMVEAIFVGLLGWVLGSILAVPISRVLSDGVGNAFSNAPLAYSFDVSGAVLWLVLAVGLALISSYLPARRASRMTLREVLAYDG